MFCKNSINTWFVFIFSIGILGSGIGIAQEHGDKVQDDPLAGVKCIVAGDNAAKIDHAAEYMGGTVYFCCDDCKKTFSENHQDYLVKANHQLVITGQYVQKACPITGMAAKDDQKVSVGGVEVGLCCGRCKSSVAGAADLADKAELVFSHDAFTKGFEKAFSLAGITCPVGGGEVSEEFSAEYMGSKVYFCCKGCAGTFAKDNDKYAALANYQLAATGQFAQKNCPFSGTAVKDEFKTSVGNVEVGFCCGGCSKKVAKLEEVEEQINLVFATEAFKKAFEQKAGKN